MMANKTLSCTATAERQGMIMLLDQKFVAPMYFGTVQQKNHTVTLAHTTAGQLERSTITSEQMDNSMYKTGDILGADMGGLALRR